MISFSLPNCDSMYPSVSSCHLKGHTKSIEKGNKERGGVRRRMRGAKHGPWRRKEKKEEKEEEALRKHAQ
jgi:hypothetical protein